MLYMDVTAFHAWQHQYVSCRVAALCLYKVGPMHNGCMYGASTLLSHGLCVCQAQPHVFPNFWLNKANVTGGGGNKQTRKELECLFQGWFSSAGKRSLCQQPHRAHAQGPQHGQGDLYLLATQRRAEEVSPLLILPPGQRTHCQALGPCTAVDARNTAHMLHQPSALPPCMR